MMKKLLVVCSLICFFCVSAKAQLHLAGYAGLAIPSAANTSYTLNTGSVLGAQVLYQIPSVDGLSVAANIDFIHGKGDSVNNYLFTPITLGVNYVWQFAPRYGLSTHIGVGMNNRKVEMMYGDPDKGVTFAYKVGLDLLVARHFSLGFRWNGLGNTSAYESVPVDWDSNGNVTRYEQRRVDSDEFSLGFFTLIAGLRF
ncbi:MAG: outer membrane beta-barrel protein [Bacteroidales bacterium]|nr:outer membrane beta-barrel protein [Bacteroidales bacterium]